MEINILDPIQIIKELFGNMYLFFAVAALAVLGVAARYRWNMQFTIISLVSWFLFLTTVVEGYAIWLGFIVLMLSYGLGYVLWRYFVPK